MIKKLIESSLTPSVSYLKNHRKNTFYKKCLLRVTIISHGLWAFVSGCCFSYGSNRTDVQSPRFLSVSRKYFSTFSIKNIVHCWCFCLLIESSATEIKTILRYFLPRWDTHDFHTVSPLRVQVMSWNISPNMVFLYFR